MEERRGYVSHIVYRNVENGYTVFELENLDEDVEEKIKNIIKDLAKTHTVIIVAHRLSTIVDADNILVLSNHQIINNGTHNELMNKCIEYKELYEIEE